VTDYQDRPIIKPAQNKYDIN